MLGINYDKYMYSKNEWINDIKKYYNIWEDNYGGFLNTAKSLINPIIKLPTEINDLEKLRDILKKDITFTLFKNVNKRKFQSLKYIPERDGGDNLKFFTCFHNLCYNTETNDIEEQKEYFLKALNDHPYFFTEFYKGMNNIKSMDELIKAFDEIVMDESNIIIDGSIVALKHVATGKYLTSIDNLHYTTGSEGPIVYTGNSRFDPNACWYIFVNNGKYNDYIYTKSDISFQHKISGNSLGICNYSQQVRYSRHLSRTQYKYHKSPSSNHTEVNCDGNEREWKIDYSRLENYEGYLKSNDIINLSIKKSFDINGHTQDGQVEFLRSHDVQFTIGNDTFQEVVCHNERLAENDEWCIELIKQA
ncbi:hypothetical protein RhiirA5_394194 [Rhizophagus irregularis]|uniref:MIR domain-containing protein n=2 Tax=Rhizophagus irregularis TaxID=588596 RepID=A0A2N0QC78_9GLOM|nr:hypothetical protein RhiirA5_394194 [Rhizophagus irregularis]